jgi:hypothetical protein
MSHTGERTLANYPPRKAIITSFRAARAKLRSTASTASHAIRRIVKPIPAVVAEESGFAETENFESPPDLRSRFSPESMDDAAPFSSLIRSNSVPRLIRSASVTLKTTGRKFRNSTNLEGLKERIGSVFEGDLEAIQEEQVTRPRQKIYLRDQRSLVESKADSIFGEHERSMSLLSIQDRGIGNHDLDQDEHEEPSNDALQENHSPQSQSTTTVSSVSTSILYYSASSLLTSPLFSSSPPPPLPAS